MKKKNKALLLRSIQLLKVKDIRILIQILTPGRHHNINETQILSLFGEQYVGNLPPFKIRSTSTGYMISFNEHPITTFDRQHGKSIHEQVFNSIRAVFTDHNLTADSIEAVLQQQGIAYKLK